MRVIFLLALAPIFAVLYGFVVSVMWAWFVVPVFHIAPLRLPYAIGLAYIVQFLTHQTNSEENEPDTARVVQMALIKPLVLLAAGWIVTWFI